LKHWQEMAQILDRVIRLGREGKTTAVAIVTAIHGSAYRRAGAKLFVEGEDGAACIGGVSGGCLEEDVRQIALDVRREGRSRVLHYDTGDDDTKLWGLGLGCDGEIDLVVLPISADAALGPWARARTLLDGNGPFTIATLAEDGAAGGILVVGPAGEIAGSLGDRALDAEAAAAGGAALAAGQSRLDVAAGRKIFTEVLLPPPTMLVCGAGDDARPLVTLAAGIGFRVSVADHRPAYLTRERFPEARQLYLLRPEETETTVPLDRDTYAVVKTHSLSRDTAWVARLLASEVPYVGVLGPKTRIVKVERALADKGAFDPARIFGPIGVDVGADGPEQIALSVIAEILAVRSHRSPRHLRERKEPIHA
jgi:xanthine dehydrogenase accessory factor